MIKVFSVLLEPLTTNNQVSHLVLVDQFDVILVWQELGHHPLLPLLFHTGGQFPWRPPCAITYGNIE